MILVYYKGQRQSSTHFDTDGSGRFASILMAHAMEFTFVYFVMHVVGIAVIDIVKSRIEKRYFSGHSHKRISAVNFPIVITP